MTRRGGRSRPLFIAAPSTTTPAVTDPHGATRSARAGATIGTCLQRPPLRWRRSCDLRARADPGRWRNRSRAISTSVALGRGSPAPDDALLAAGGPVLPRRRRQLSPVAGVPEQTLGPPRAGEARADALRRRTRGHGLAVRSRTRSTRSWRVILRATIAFGCSGRGRPSPVCSAPSRTRRSARGAGRARLRPGRTVRRGRGRPWCTRGPTRVPGTPRTRRRSSSGTGARAMAQTLGAPRSGAGRARTSASPQVRSVPNHAACAARWRPKAAQAARLSIPPARARDAARRRPGPPRGWSRADRPCRRAPGLGPEEPRSARAGRRGRRRAPRGATSSRPARRERGDEPRRPAEPEGDQDRPEVGADRRGWARESGSGGDGEAGLRHRRRLSSFPWNLDVDRRDQAGECPIFFV